jgi:hypothetical protein
VSNALANALPVALPTEDRQPRHIEIVSTRSQRLARPRPIYAVILVGGLFVLFIAQLLLSIVVSNGAYQISTLQGQQRDLTRTADALSEKDDLLASPQALGEAADKLGMGMTSRTPAFVDLESGKVVGKAREASSGNGTALSPTIANQPLEDAQKASKQAAKANDKADTSSASTTATASASGSGTASSTASSTASNTDTEQDALSADAGTAIDTTAPSVASGVIPSPKTH